MTDSSDHSPITLGVEEELFLVDPQSGNLLADPDIVIDPAAKHGASVMAASTHPFACWQRQKVSPKKRYKNFLTHHQDDIRRFVINGMHVHAGFGDSDTRILVMTALRRYLPLLHALSAFFPIGRDTGIGEFPGHVRTLGKFSHLGNFLGTGGPGPPLRQG